MNSEEQNISGSEGRVPPQAPEVEEGVLGAMLVEHEALETGMAALGQDPKVFYVPKHQTVYEGILEVYRKNDGVDILTVENHLRDKHLLATIGGAGFLSDLTRAVSSAANIDYHAQILNEKFTKRKIILGGSDVINEAYDSSSDPYDVLDHLMRVADSVSDTAYKDQGMLVSDALESVLEDIEFRRDNPGLSGVPSGMPVDKYTGGWQNGKLYIIAARPSIGKSAFVTKAGFNASLYANERYRTNVFMWNGEMQNIDIIKRRLAMEAKVNGIKIRDGKISDIEMKRLIEAAGHLFNSRVFIDDTPGIHIKELRAKYKTAIRRHDIGLCIVDYLQLMSGMSEGTREQEISSISRGLKALAKETNTPVIALSQLSREPEKREGAEPFLSDLRESGSLEQDADGVIMLNRPEFFGHNMFKGRPTEGKGHVKIEKMRDGMTGDFWMDFVKQYADWRVPAGKTNKNSVMAPPPKAPIPHSLYEDDEAFDDDAPF